MATEALHLNLIEALAQADAAVDAIAAAGLQPSTIDEANAQLRHVERLHRKVSALQVDLVASIDRSKVFAGDGHRTAKAQVARVARVSPFEAGRRLRAARALQLLPAVAKAFAAGDLGSAQVDRIARVAGNPRVRSQLEVLDDHVAVIACQLPYADLDRKLTEWERLTDEDGAGSGAARRQRDRNASMLGDYDGGWTTHARHGSVEGAENRAIFDAFVQAEHEADWAEARARVGDAATADDLARTDAQRRADAFTGIFRRAADARAAAPGGSVIETVLVMDQATFERQAFQLADGTASAAPQPGAAGPASAPETSPPPGPAEHLSLSEPASDPHPQGDRPPTPVPVPAPPTLSLDPDPGGVTGRCSTLDGQPVDAAEATMAGLVGTIRRAVLGADGVVIDLGRKVRLFSGLAQLAARLSSCSCIWPGCTAPASRSQTDHLRSWSDGGGTDQRNAAILCGFHNRRKQHGFTPSRLPDGSFKILRPDGSWVP